MKCSIAVAEIIRDGGR